MNTVKIFGNAGAVAHAMHAGYEYRHQQIAMAEAVENALYAPSHLIVEAGTGVGKSLAYLIPLIQWAREQGKRAVVSTYTKALQQQLVEKDLPFLRNVLGDFRFALCLGGENYLCLKRFDQLRMYDLFEQSEIEHVNRLFEWSTMTRVGLRTELEIEPPAGLWAKACRQGDLCFGKDCAYNRECFYLKAKAVEQQAHILVANHHLFFADMATGGNVLPLYHTVVFDEAHQVEDVATDYLGIEVSNFSVRYLFDSLMNQRTRKGMLTRLTVQGPGVRTIQGMLEDLRGVADDFFQNVTALLKENPVLRIRRANIVPDILSEPLLALKDELLALDVDSQEEEMEVKSFANRIQAMAAAVVRNLSQEQQEFVYWAERENNRIRLVASPIDLAQILREGLFAKIDTVVLTSATLSISGTYTYIKSRFGLDAPTELILDSPFDFEQQALVYISRNLENQRQSGYQEKFDEELTAILSITGGRTLVLFTSYSQLRKSAEAVRGTMPALSVLCQGEIPPYRLVEQFKGRSNAVLFGTASFWQGIDIPGDALQCVVIAKLPFAVPDDPIIEARMERLRNPFYEYQVPQATLLFRQGFGRLIRMQTDRGAVAVLDSRIMTKGYGKWFLNSLPQCRMTDDRDDFKDFFAGLKAGRN